MTDLPGVFGTVAPYLEDYGYLAVFLAVVIENFGIPMPGEATLILAALFSVSGVLDLRIVIAVAFVAAVLGDNLGYAFGRFGGRPLVLRIGRRFGVTNTLLDKVEVFFDRHGAKVVVAARFLPIMRHLNGISAGLSHMAWRRFLAANIAGAAIWVAVWCFVGVRAGEHIDTIHTVLEEGFRWVVVALVVLVALWVVRHRVARRASAVPVASPEAVTGVASRDERHLTHPAQQPEPTLPSDVVDS
ncbi:MAG: DedA family protein [Nocardioides sp.]